MFSGPSGIHGSEGTRTVPGAGPEGQQGIFKRLITERSPEFFSFGHTFDDYPWDYHDLQAQAGVPEERRYIHSWRYLIKRGVRQGPAERGSIPAVGRIGVELAGLENFVVDSYGSRDPDLTQLFRPPRKKLRFKGWLRLAIAVDQRETVSVKELSSSHCKKSTGR